VHYIGQRTWWIIILSNNGYEVVPWASHPITSFWTRVEHRADVIGISRPAGQVTVIIGEPREMNSVVSAAQWPVLLVAPR